MEPKIMFKRKRPSVQNALDGVLRILPEAADFPDPVLVNFGGCYMTTDPSSPLIKRLIQELDLVEVDRHWVVLRPRTD